MTKAKYLEMTKTAEGYSFRHSRINHMSGYAWFDDGVLYWEAGIHRGRRPIDQTNIDADSNAALRYAEVCIGNSIEKDLKRWNVG